MAASSSYAQGTRVSGIETFFSSVGQTCVRNMGGGGSILLGGVNHRGRGQGQGVNTAVAVVSWSSIVLHPLHVLQRRLLHFPWILQVHICLVFGQMRVHPLYRHVNHLNFPISRKYFHDMILGHS